MPLSLSLWWLLLFFFFHHFNTPFFSSSLISGTCHLHFHPHSFLPLTCNKNTEALDPSQKDICASHAPSAFLLPPYLAPCTSITWPRFASRLQTQFGVLSAFWISTQDLLCGRKRTNKKKLQRYYTWKSKGMAVCVTCAAIWTLSTQQFFCFTVYVHQTSCSMTRTWYQRKLTSVCWETMGYYLANCAFYSIRQVGSRFQLKEPSPAPSELSPLHCWYTAGLAGCPCGVMQVDGLPRLRLTPTDFRTAVRAAALSVFRV